MRRGAGIVALTGASGFVGSALLQALLAAGYRVCALEHRTKLPAHPSLTTVSGTLDDAATAAALVAGADTVIHAGGLVMAPRMADFFRVNATATGQLADAAQQAGVTRFLFISSLAARAPHLSPYAASKYAAEQLLAQRPGLAWDILRPPAIYGPGDANSLPFLAMLARGRLWLPVAPDALISMLYVDDLVAAILAWLARDAAPGRQTYELADHDGGYRWRELAALAGQALAHPVHLRCMPRGLALAAASGMQFFARVFHRPCFLSPGKIREMAHPDWSVNSAAFTEITGWSAQVMPAQGLAATLSWYQNQGRFPHKK